ncbi:DUF6355 family natural product biosynthesis protein [Amycolatopsis magusensis]|uniref:DUF6355 family natural product biosynthesis protein n=1 Tax=Amycolatopsis magusensis TaxID=882444 RepID=UPI003795828B
MRSASIRTGAALAGAVALALGVAAPVSAAPLPASAAVLTCGYHETVEESFYNHCTSDGSSVWIRVEMHHGIKGKDVCAHPGENRLGYTAWVAFAWYKGTLC